MNHLGTVRLETERLILRRFAKTDIPAAFRNWMSDEKVTTFLRWSAHRDVTTTENVIKDWIQSYEKLDFYQWAIVPKGSVDEPIGTISVVDQNDRLGILHFGYCIGSKWWHQGITSEALSGVIPFLFDQVQANRIESWHDPENPHSGNVMAKCGLKFEGSLRQADFRNRGIVDACVYSILAGEYYCC